MSRPNNHPEVEAAFRAELEALLKKWDADLEAHHEGFIQVTIGAICAGADLVRPYTEFHL